MKSMDVYENMMGKRDPEYQAKCSSHTFSQEHESFGLARTIRE